MLVGIARRYLRRCSNTLQFIKARNQEVPEHIIRRATVSHSQIDWEAITRTCANEEIYKSLAGYLQTASTRYGRDYRRLCGSPILLLEFAPYLNRIIPSLLRPGNSQVIRPEEKALLARLVSIMPTLELQFFQQCAEDGTLTIFRWGWEPQIVSVRVRVEGGDHA
ncbi:AAA domain-containing protein [Mycena kentingensis (nom. inval.)]|nr:AAA domain-containing protein [Mycena kentingensis (nom. inval.)]